MSTPPGNVNQGPHTPYNPYRPGTGTGHDSTTTARGGGIGVPGTVCPVLGTVPLSIPRTVAEATRAGIAIPKEDRNRLLKGNKLVSYEKEASSPLKRGQFAHLNLLDPRNSTDIAQCSKLGMKVKALAEELEHHDMLHVFNIPTNWVEHHSITGTVTHLPDQVNPCPVNIVATGIATVKKDHVYEASSYYYLRGAEPYFIQNLVWSKNKILDSCEPITRNQLSETLQGLDPEHQTGPVAFYELLLMITATEDRTVQAMIDSFRQLKLSHDFAGEDVLLCTTYIRGFNTWLSSVTTSIPLDFLLCTMEIFTHAHNEEFVDAVKAIHHNHDEGLKTYALEPFLHKVEQIFGEQTRLNKWIVPKSASVFTAEMRKCFHCGLIGHLANQCPQCGYGGGGGRGGQGGGRSSRRQGRGGRGGRGGNHSPAKPEYRPPGKDEPHEKTLQNGVSAKWCAKCAKIDNGRYFHGVWVYGDKAHNTAEHNEQNALVVTPEERVQAKGKQGKPSSAHGTAPAQPKAALKASSSATCPSNRQLSWQHVMDTPAATTTPGASFNSIHYAGI